MRRNDSRDSLRGVHVRMPAVAQCGRTPHRCILAARYPDRHAARLNRSRQHVGVGELEDPAVVVEALAGPELANDLDRFGRPAAALPHRDTAARELPGIVAADTDSEYGAAPRQDIEAGKLFRDQGRMPERQQQRRRTDLDARSQRGGPGERGHRLHDGAVIDDVLAGPEGVVAELLNGADLIRLPDVTAACDSNSDRHDDTPPL